MARWLVKLEGANFDLEDFPYRFPSGPALAMSDSNGTYLAGEVFESLGDASAARRILPIVESLKVKIGCHCGHEIVDAETSPQKGHLIPDQDWFTTHEALDNLIEEVAKGGCSKDDAQHRARTILSRSARMMWLCWECGRLHVDGWDHQLRCFTPEGESIDRDVLRGRPKRP